MSPPGRGGSRPGAGRTPQEPTQRLRVPESQVPAVLAWLDAYRQPPSLEAPRPLSLTPSTVALTAFSIVVAIVNGDFSIKRLGKIGDQVALLPENAHFKPIVFKEGETLELWGVVTRCLRKLR